MPPRVSPPKRLLPPSTSAKNTADGEEAAPPEVPGTSPIAVPTIITKSRLQGGKVASAPSSFTPSSDLGARSSSQRSVSLVAKPDQVKSEPVVPNDPDHLFIIVPGIGSRDNKSGAFAPFRENAENFRSKIKKNIKRHFEKENYQVEILYVDWCTKLHMLADDYVECCTLQGVPKLRSLINSTFTDVLFYMTPKYEKIIRELVTSQLNITWHTFKKFHPNYNGRVTVLAHSLGSLIMFDTLRDQPAMHSGSGAGTSSPGDKDSSLPETSFCRTSHWSEKEISAADMASHFDRDPTSGVPLLDFAPSALVTLGSPIGLFVGVRGQHEELLGQPHFSSVFQTCDAWYNVFHPHDIVAYRIEPHFDQQWSSVPPVEVEYNKGGATGERGYRKLKRWLKIGKKGNADIGNDVIPVFEEEDRGEGQPEGDADDGYQEDDDDSDESLDSEAVGNSARESLNLGTLAEALVDDRDVSPTKSGTSRPYSGAVPQGQGKARLDYQLQATGMQAMNEYLLSFKSHWCYWTNSDTCYFILRKVRKFMDIARKVHTGVKAAGSDAKLS